MIDLNTMLLSICDTGKHKHGKDHTLLMIIKNYMCACTNILLSITLTLTSPPPFFTWVKCGNNS